VPVLYSNINCVKTIIMSQHTSVRKSKENFKNHPARVIPISNTGAKRGKSHGGAFDNKSKNQLPMYNNERIFKPKKHDPL
jgi:hypothetical protein